MKINWRVSERRIQCATGNSGNALWLLCQFIVLLLYQISVIMRQLLVLAALAGLAMARPETYREKEDFQFSRSSTDEGSKSGFYGAQRGNMGGNYERAHNMDPLAQNQMSGLVRTVEGELGDGAKQHTGSVYTAANSRGVYGSGNYDLSNLEGRNFQESVSYGASQSHSSLTSQHGSAYKGQHSTSNTGGYSQQSLNAGHGSSQSYDSRYGGHNSAGYSEQDSYSNSHQQASNNLQPASQYEARNTAQNTGYAGQNSGYYSQSAGYQGQGYDQGSSLTSSGYGSTIHSKLVSGTPVRIVIRPGTRVYVPVAAQTYDASQSAASFDQNAINSETEVLNGNDQQVVLKPKHYEANYSYRKEWEKHDTKPVGGAVPLTIPTINPYPTNSELYEDAQAQASEQQQQITSGIASQSHHSSHNGYNVNSASSSQSRQAEYNTQHLSSGANTVSNAYNGDSTGTYSRGATGTYNRGASGAYIGANSGASNLNQLEDTNNKPKSYQSSYSYHKSWERQGDPYIIKPSANDLTDGQVSGKLTAASSNEGFQSYGNSHQYGSQSHHQSHQGYSSNVDCDENGHIRVARSYDAYRNHAQTRGDVGGQEELGQQTQKQLDNIEDLGQQTQSKWGNFEELGQQTQKKSDKIEDLGQQTQNTWDQFGQQQMENKPQDEGQQTQMLWGQQETQNQWDQIEDIGKQAQSHWNQHDASQQTQNTWDQLELEPQSQTDLGQQTQDAWTVTETKPSGDDSSPTGTNASELDNSRQDKHGMTIGNKSNQNTFEITQSNHHQKHNTESHTLLSESTNKTHHVHTIWDEIKKEEIGQENEDTVESDTLQTADLDQQTLVTHNQNENSYNPWHQETVDQIQVDLTNSKPNHSNNFFVAPNPHPWMYNQVHHQSSANTNQYFEHSSSSILSGSESHSWQEMNSNYNSSEQTHSTGSSGSSIMGLWDKIETIVKQTIPSHGTDDASSQYVGHESITNDFSTQAQHNAFNSNTTNTPLQPNTFLNASATVRPTTEALNKDDKILTHDIGRGDIGAEDLFNEKIESHNSKPYETPEEIETLSQTKKTDTTDKHNVTQDENKEDEKYLSVMSLDQQNQSERQDKDKVNSMWQTDASVKITTSTSTTQSNNYHYMHNSNEEKESRALEQEFEDQGQKNLDQQTLVHQFEESQENQHQDTDQQFVDFGQQSENLRPEQMEQQFEIQNIGQSFHQKHETDDLGQQNEQFDQVSLSGWKPDDNLHQQEQKFENSGRDNDNLEQQSQSGWTENMEDQQVQTAWKPTDKSQQQSQLTEPFANPMEDLSQQVEPAFLSPTEDLQQQSQLADTFSQSMDQNEHSSTYHKQLEVSEELIVPKKVAAVDSPPEVEANTEKPGFWKSVGSKFTNAKDKVTSWFSSR